MFLHVFTQTTCEGWEQSETSEGMLVSVGCPAASLRMSWPMTAARADRRAQHWRLIASNENHCSPQRRMNAGLPLKPQHFNPLWCETPHQSFLDTILTAWKAERVSAWSAAHCKWKGGIPDQLAQPQSCAKHWSCQKILNPAWICLNLPFQDRLIF